MKKLITRRKLLQSTALAAPALILPSRKLLARSMHGTGGGGGGYVAKAVHFDGSTSLTLAALLAGSDNGNFLSSFWIKCSTSDFSSSFAFWASDPESSGAAFCSPSSSPNRFVTGFNHGLSNVELTTPDIDADTWHNILIAMQTNAAPGSRVLQLYLDDIPFSGPSVNNGSAFSVVFNGKSFWFGDDSFGDNFNGDVADPWIGMN